ncbi:MAG: hypothetical protein KKA28_12245 [Planctomycetes bacterium]|nr:hypothetical protein [Planctomycetota bacterium]MCG2683203.1 hypothetical protein [Planctomycetales bacterium]
MTFNRRSFLAAVGAAAFADPLRGAFAADAVGDDVAERIRPYLDCPDPALWRLAVDVYRNCVLGKVRPPEPPFRHRWIMPGDHYKGQWIWDTMFVVDLLAVLPDQREVIREAFQNYWDYQARWDAVKPDYARGFIPCAMFPDSHRFSAAVLLNPTLKVNRDWKVWPAYSQIPILGWGMERVYRRNGDIELVRAGIGPIERFHDWYWRERDVTDVGLIGLGSYDGDIQNARNETFDYECDLDDLKMTPHPLRKGPNEGPWYGDILVPGNTAYLILGEQSLVRLAQAAGDAAMAERRQARIQKGIAAMRQHMWDQKTGTFLAVKRDSLEKVPVATIGSWIPLMAGVPTEEMAARMADVLATDEWMTPLPVCTVGRHDPRFGTRESFWRGDVWPPTNYQIAAGLSQYGHKELAAKIVDATVSNALKVGVYERYDSLTGKPLGVPGNGMSCTVLTMVLNGLSRQYRAKVKAK